MTSPISHHTKTYSRLFTTLAVTAAILSISACQHLPTPDIGSLHTNASTRCLQHSGYQQPVIAGKIIDTPNYMLITIGNAASIAQTTGKLCIINKANGHLDITAIEQLRFLPHS